MTTRDDLNLYSTAVSKVVGLAKADLDKFWQSLDLSNPLAVRDALLEFVPALVREYGDVAAAAAADWYEELRSGVIAGNYRAVTGGVVDVPQVEASVRYAAGHLFTGSPEQALSVINGSVQRFVQYSGRETIARNVSRDRSKPRYARVPQGRTTCAFCSLLASRGFVYHSKKKAALGKDGNKYHDDCDCQIVPSWDESPYIEGYDPDELYGQYQAARESADGTTARSITKAMRREFPESYTDGVETSN